ncbi:MAG: transposase [Richelia sp.]|nr:transposase [Richelia sp.]
MSKNKPKTYTLEFKKESSRLALDSEQSISQTARNLGIGVSTLHGWISKYYPNEISSEITNGSDTDISVELKNLKKEFSRVRQERDILKKAMACFTKEIR